MKRCPRCGCTLDESQFGKNRSTRDGLATYCKKCHTEQSTEYAKAHREERLAYLHKYYQQNKDELLRKQKEYAANNPEKRKAYKKRYYQAHREELLEKQRANRERIKADPELLEKQRARKREYARTHPERIRENFRKWREDPDNRERHLKRMVEYQREKYANDPEYRERKNQKRRDYYFKRKAAK